MNQQPTADQVRQCLDGFTNVADRPVPGNYYLTVLCATDQGDRFLYNVRRRDLGPKAKDVKKWILQPKLDTLLGKSRKRKGAVTLGQAIKDMDFSSIGPGFRRGMIMSKWKDIVDEVTGREDWRDHLDRAWLTGEKAEKDSDDFQYPKLIIRMDPGSLWITELHHQRYRIMWKLNEQFDEKILREVRIK